MKTSNLKHHISYLNFDIIFCVVEFMLYVFNMHACISVFFQESRLEFCVMFWTTPKYLVVNSWSVLLLLLQWLQIQKNDVRHSQWITLSALKLKKHIMNKVLHATISVSYLPVNGQITNLATSSTNFRRCSVRPIWRSIVLRRRCRRNSVSQDIASSNSKFVSWPWS